MPHYRTEHRTSVRNALAADPSFASFQNFDAWSQTMDEDQLPFYAVATPRERKDRTTLTSSTRDTVLVAVFKLRGGDDLEDKLDDLSVPAELAIIGAVGTDADCLLDEVSIGIDGEAGNRVGTLTMQFTITIWPNEPITL